MRLIFFIEPGFVLTGSPDRCIFNLGSPIYTPTPDFRVLTPLRQIKNYKSKEIIQNIGKKSNFSRNRFSDIQPAARKW